MADGVSVDKVVCAVSADIQSLADLRDGHIRDAMKMRGIMPPMSFLPTRGTSQMPTMMPIVITAATVTYCEAVSSVSLAYSSPMALRALAAAGVS